MSVLWLLEWGITGTLLTYLSLYFEDNQLPLADVGPVMATGAIGLWVAPLVVGQICDRWMSAERYLALAHFVGGLTLLAIPIAVDVYRETHASYRIIFMLFGLYAAAYVPTVALATALTFRHLPNPKQQFGGVRVWGTIGWVLAGIGLSFWLERGDVDAWIRAHRPNWVPALDSAQAVFHWLPAASSRDAFRIAALMSFTLSTFCIFLPHTPPARTAQARAAPLQVLTMFRKRSFGQLIVASFALALVIPLYNLAVPPLLKDYGFRQDWIPAVMTIGQISEPPTLLLLSFILRRFGLKATFGLGIAAWLARYLIFASGANYNWILAGIALHGICHVCLVIVIQLYLDAECPPDLRNSVQNLFAFLTLGVAMPVGLLLSQPLIQLCTSTNAEGNAVVNFPAVFVAGAFVLTLLMIAYWWWFHTPGSEKENGGPQPSPVHP
ncbi:MAG: MFS transporter [Planctomycetaceae bacterium]